MNSQSMTQTLTILAAFVYFSADYSRVSHVPNRSCCWNRFYRSDALPITI